MNAGIHRKRLQNMGKVRKLNGPKRRCKRRSALEHSEPAKEVRAMSHCGQYYDSIVKIKTELQAARGLLAGAK